MTRFSSPLKRRIVSPNTRSLEFIIYTSAPIIEFWADKTLFEIKKKTCAEYVEWRTSQGVTLATARHDLKTLRAAVRYYHGEHGPLASVPVVHMPDKPQPRVDYWLTREKVAERIRSARRGVRTRHVIRLILIGVYTGTRPGACFKLRWLPSTEGGWIDLESETLHRRAVGTTETKKRAPAARIHRRLLPHLKRWRKADMAQGITHVIHYQGLSVLKVRKAWAQIAILAGHATKDKAGDWIVPDGPHICRHTCATWLMQSGIDIHEAAGYLGMSEKTLLEVYGHHHPDFQGKASSATGKRKA
jgi:integrase